MEINWVIISIVAICVIILVFYIIKRNIKDEKDLETFLNKDDHPISNHEGGVNDDE